MKIVRFALPVLLLAAAHYAAAEDPAPFSPSRTVIVVAAKAPVMAGKETLNTVSSGAVLRYSKEDGDWLLIPRDAGWIKRESVQPIETAEGHFSGLLQQKPTSQNYQNRGIVRSELNRFDDAIADFDEALKLTPKSSAILVNRGLARQRAGKSEAALEDYTQAITLNPDEQQALLNRSTLLLESGQLDAALVDIESLLKLDPDSAEAHNNRGVVHRLQGHFAEALEDYAKAIELFPHYAAAFANRGYVEKKLGQYEAAIADYENARKLDPQLIDSINDAAWLLATCKDEKYRNPQQAIELAEQAKTLAGKPVGEYLDTLAAAYAAAGRFDDAAKAAEESLQLVSDADKPGVAERLEKYRKQEAYIEP
jgi:tetratricopeptide (TPR) repeat protein